MNNSFARLIDGMCATLRTEVLTRLDDEFARGQVFGVINLLNTFKVRGDWSVVFLSEQLKAQYESLQKVAALLQSHPGAPAGITITAPDVLTSDDLLRMRDANNVRINEILGWIDSHRATLGEAQTRQLEQPLRQALKREIELELKYSPRPLFAEMSSGKEI